MLVALVGLPAVVSGVLVAVSATGRSLRRRQRTVRVWLAASLIVLALATFVFAMVSYPR